MPYADPDEKRACQRRWYGRNREKEIARSKARKDELRAFIQSQKAKPCADCGGEFPPVAMDFDHREAIDKDMSVAQLARYGSKKRIENEIAKCDLVCANCHRVRTAERSKRSAVV